MDGRADVRYAIGRDARLAFRIFSGGPQVVVWVPAWISNQDVADPELDPQRASMYERMAPFATSVTYDARGTGLSDPLPLADLPELESWVEDLHAVITTAGFDDVVLVAQVTSGPVAMLYAAIHPERTRALILLNAFAAVARRDGYDAGFAPEEYEQYVEWVGRVWGTGQFLLANLPDRPIDDALVRDLARGERQSMAPSVVVALLRWLYAIDVRAVLPAIAAPTLVLHTLDNRFVSGAHGRYLARHIPDAQLVELPGGDVSLFPGSAVATRILDEIEEFMTGARATADHTRMLTTLLFTDVVASTERVAAVGDRAWSALLDRHDDSVRRQLARFAGHQEKLTGDGILATFDGPARAIHCGIKIRDTCREMGVDVRVGIHTGEVERRSSELAGIAVHLAHRVCEAARPGEVLVSRTVVDLVAGSDVSFVDRGEHDLKGIPAAWRLFAVNT